MNTGERIRFVRKNHKMTQEALANTLGISRTHISKIENNQDSPSERLLRQISSTFRINYDWLTTGNGDVHYDSNKNSITLDQCFSLLQQYSKKHSPQNVEAIATIIMNIVESSDFISNTMSLNGTNLIDISHEIKELYRYWIDIISNTVSISEDEKSDIKKISQIHQNRINTYLSSDMEFFVSNMNEDRL